MSSYFQIISVHPSLPLFTFRQWKDKCTSYSFTTKKLTHSMCQVSLVIKYTNFEENRSINAQNRERNQSRDECTDRLTMKR